MILFLTLLLLVTYYMFRKKNIKAIEQNKKFKALEEKNQSKQNIESNEQSNKKDKK